MDTATITQQLRAFAARRNWEQFHTPRNLLLALIGEVGELAELFQWRTDDQIHSLMQEPGSRACVEKELADIAIYLIRLVDVLEVDLDLAVTDKIAENARKYPAEQVRGSAAKYTDYQTDAADMRRDAGDHSAVLRQPSRSAALGRHARPERRLHRPTPCGHADRRSWPGCDSCIPPGRRGSGVPPATTTRPPPMPLRALTGG